MTDKTKKSLLSYSLMIITVFLFYQLCTSESSSQRESRLSRERQERTEQRVNDELKEDILTWLNDIPLTNLASGFELKVTNSYIRIYLQLTNTTVSTRELTRSHLIYVANDISEKIDQSRSVYVTGIQRVESDPTQVRYFGEAKSLQGTSAVTFERDPPL